MTTVVIKNEATQTIKEIEWLYLKEGAIRSILTDLFTFGIIFAGFFLNRYYFGNKWYLDVFFIFCLLVQATSYGSNRRKVFHNKKDLKKYVDSL